MQPGPGGRPIFPGRPGFVPQNPAVNGPPGPQQMQQSGQQPVMQQSGPQPTSKFSFLIQGFPQQPMRRLSQTPGPQQPLGMRPGMPRPMLPRPMLGQPGFRPAPMQSESQDGSNNQLPKRPMSIGPGSVPFAPGTSQPMIPRPMTPGVPPNFQRPQFNPQQRPLNQPSAQFNQPLQRPQPPMQPQAPAQFNQPPVPQFSQPQFNQQPPAQFNQQMPQQDQLMTPGAVPRFGGSDTNLNQHAQPADVGGMAGQFGQMSFQSIARPFNLMSGPPDPNGFTNLSVDSSLTADSSASRASSSVCPSYYKRCTLNAIPQTAQLLGKCKLPFALLLTPYRQVLEKEETSVPVIQPEAIVRCRRCRAYINPWVQFTDQGTRWKCNMCYLPNDVPAFFDYDSDNRISVDRFTRPELTHAVVEYIAPQEYMVRPPQPVVFLFLIDVSFAAIQSGIVHLAAKTILENLEKLPNADSRTKIAFICYDSFLHFFNLNASQTEPQLVVVPDLDDVFLPLPYDLLVNLSESKMVIKSLLEKLPSLFKDTQNNENCLGKAIQFAFKLISPIGGKICVLNNTLPNTGEAPLKQREDPKLFGTPKESQLLQPTLPFYKNFAVDCSRSQVSIDLFLFGSQYNDVATLCSLSKVTAGGIHYYPGFNGLGRVEDAAKFTTEFGHYLSRPLGLEAVLRVRACKGIRMTNYHGNFFLRSTDLLALPNVSPDQSFGVEMAIDENLTGIACFQTALLHTSINGERRIRVITSAIPTTADLTSVFSGADQFAIAALLAKKGVERSLASKMEDSREAIQFKLNEIMLAFKQNFSTGVQVAVPENLKLLPVLIQAILKHVSIRMSSSIPTDLRSYAMTLVYTLPVEILIHYIYPRFYSILQSAPDGSPMLMNATSEKLDRHGLFLLENGFEIFIWVGKLTPPEVIQLIFDRPMYDALPNGKYIVPILKNDLNQRVVGLIDSIKRKRLVMATTSPHCYIVKEDGDPSLRAWFLSMLVEDKIESLVSYPQFLNLLREQIAKN